MTFNTSSFFVILHWINIMNLKNMLSFYSIEYKFQQVFQLATEIWNDNYKGIISKEQIDYMFSLMYNPNKRQQDLDEGYIWEFIKHDDETVGYLAYLIKRDNRVFLSKIYLKTCKQGKGLGKKAINRVLSFARTNNCSAVYLTVNKGNTKAIKAYKSTGFTITTEQITDIGHGYVMDDYVFEYQIN